MTWDDARATLVSIGKQVRFFRLRAGITQEELASRTKGALGRTSIVNIEKGRQKMTVLSLVTVARALGVAPGDLVTGNDPDDLVEVRIGDQVKMVPAEVADRLLEAAQ